MGGHQSRSHVSDEDPVSFDHFQVLRAIGKGSFGKVCIVQKKDKLYAMKYMNKLQCLQKDAMKNVLREIEILVHLEHPFLVNLWFSFQDEEDMFMVVDLLLGGDLRYHIQQDVIFTAESIRLFMLELGSALDYLKSKNIVHRDIKPENVLLDEEGHAHLTDFNIATVLKPGQGATSVSGTKPYMAPEVYECATRSGARYGFEVDWWSLGVCVFELSTGNRPFDIHSVTSAEDCLKLFAKGYYMPSCVCPELQHLLRRMLTVNVDNRLASLEEALTTPFLRGVSLNAVLQKQITPAFTPPKDHLNCDPTLELEEMIMEAKPLHKKKKRLLKQRSRVDSGWKGSSIIRETMGPLGTKVSAEESSFITFNREHLIVRQAKETKEKEWEQELLNAMENSDPLRSATLKENDCGSVLCDTRRTLCRIGSPKSTSPRKISLNCALSPRSKDKTSMWEDGTNGRFSPQLLHLSPGNSTPFLGSPRSLPNITYKNVKARIAGSHRTAIKERRESQQLSTETLSA